MRKRRFKDGWTLEQIGQENGISRERVRKIIGNTGHEFRSKWTRNYIEQHPEEMISAHLSEIRGLPGSVSAWREKWGDYPHEMKGVWHKEHRECELQAQTMLRDIGIKSEINPTQSKFDLLTESGCKVAISHTSSDISTAPSQVFLNYPTWSIQTKANPRDYDFLIAFIPDTFFVIPSEEIGYRNPASRIRIPWPKMGQKPSKWHKWHERIDLIY